MRKGKEKEERGEKGGQVEEKKDKEVDEDVMGWVQVRRKTRRRVVQEGTKMKAGRVARWSRSSSRWMGPEQSR